MSWMMAGCLERQVSRLPDAALTPIFTKRIDPQSKVRRADSRGLSDLTRHDDHDLSRPWPMITAVPSLSHFTMNYLDTSYFAAPLTLVVKAVSPAARMSSQRDIPPRPGRLPRGSAQSACIAMRCDEPQQGAVQSARGRFPVAKIGAKKSGRVSQTRTQSGSDRSGPSLQRSSSSQRSGIPPPCPSELGLCRTFGGGRMC